MLMNMATTQSSSLLRTHRLQRDIVSTRAFGLATVLLELLKFPILSQQPKSQQILNVLSAETARALGSDRLESLDHSCNYQRYQPEVEKDQSRHDEEPADVVIRVL